MNSAARVLDPHTCPVSAPIPHIGGVVKGPGVPTVVIGHQVAATQGTTCACVLGLPNTVVGGLTTVQIASMSAARVGDPTAHGGRISAGYPTALIGG